MFWVNFNNDRIVRGQGIEMPSTYEDLVTSDISCAGNIKFLSRIISKCIKFTHCVTESFLYTNSLL